MNALIIICVLVSVCPISLAGTSPFESPDNFIIVGSIVTQVDEIGEKIHGIVIMDCLTGKKAKLASDLLASFYSKAAVSEFLTYAYHDLTVSSQGSSLSITITKGDLVQCWNINSALIVNTVEGKQSAKLLAESFGVSELARVLLNLEISHQPVEMNFGERWPPENILKHFEPYSERNQRREE